jgi:hypothetical protein
MRALGHGAVKNFAECVSSLARGRVFGVHEMHIVVGAEVMRAVRKMRCLDASASSCDADALMKFRSGESSPFLALDACSTYQLASSDLVLCCLPTND